MNPVSKSIFQATQIPSLPEALHQVLQASNDPLISAVQLERLVLKDPGLTLRVLRLVNSPFYGVPNRVSSVGQAIVLLGMSVIRNIASGLVMLEAFGRIKTLDTAYLAAVWRHSLAVSKIVTLVAEPESAVSRMDLSLAGMVHDVGHLLLLRHFGGRYLRMASGCALPPVELELQELSIDHAELGGDLLESWSFPPAIVSWVRLHHTAAPQGPDKGPQQLRAADLIEEGASYSPAFLLTPRSELPAELGSALDALGLSWESIQKRQELVLEWIRSSGSAGL